MLSKMLWGSASLLALSAVGALAQEEDIIVLDEVVVRGELQGRDLQETATSVAVETGEDLERRADDTLYNVIARTPNVTSPGERGFTIRGIDQNGTGGSGLLVSTQVDGVALPDSQSTNFGPYSNWDVQQTEVLRGPQSTQQGRNSLAGAIVVRTNDPTFDKEFKVRAEFGSRNHHRVAIAANTPLIADTLAFRFAAETSQNDGFVDNPTLGTDYDARELDSYRAKLRFDPTDNFSAVLAYSVTEYFGGEDLVDRNQFPTNRFNFSNVVAREGSKHRNLGLRTNWDINATLTLETETSYYTHDYVRIEDFDQTAADLGLLDATGEADVFEQDIRLKFETGIIKGVAGLFYTKFDTTRPSTASVPGNSVDPRIPVGVTVNQIRTPIREVENAAIFGEVDVDVDEWVTGLSFTVGARYDREKVVDTTTNIVTLNPAIPLPLPPSTTIRTESTFTAFLPKFGITYDWTPDVSTSFTIQRGYRAGGSHLNTFTGAISEFNPEYTTNYELAFRGEFNDGLLRTNANVFYTEWDDQQVTVIGASGNSFDTNIINAGESRLYGLEFSLEAQVTPQLNLFASYGYTKTEFLNFVSNGVNLAGNEFRNAPRHSAAFGGQYAFDNGVTFAADASYTDSSFSNATNLANEESDGAFLVNTQLTYEKDNLIIGAYVRNLFDQDYITQAFNVAGFPDRGRTGEPLTVGAFIQRSF